MSTKELTWSDWLGADQDSADLLHLSPERAARPWNPTAQDRAAAWILYTEIRTRISTQPLHYRSGDEETALRSLYELFGMTRQVITQHGPECRHLATIAIQVLNRHIRPLTAKWHRRNIAGYLLHDDDRREFRRELSAVQARLIAFCRILGRMAEGDEYLPDEACGSFRQSADADRSVDTGADIPFDRILLDKEVQGRDALLAAEQDAIRERRKQQGVIKNLAGLACSGGGIRSATFCLGVAQALAPRGLLPRIDYLSTVSGGGYFGSFLSSYLNDERIDAVGLEPERLPFAEADRPEPVPIRRLRNNSKYLLKGGLLVQARAGGLLLVGTLINLLTLLPVVLIAVTLTLLAGQLGMTTTAFQKLAGTAIAILLVALGVVVLGLPCVYRRWASNRAAIATYERVGIALALALVVVWALGSVLPQIYQGLFAGGERGGTLLGIVLSIAALSATAAFRFGPASVLGRILLIVAGITGPVLVLVSYLVLNAWLDAWLDNRWWLLGLVALSAGSILWLRSINVNQFSPHRYYRNRLAETYLLRRDSVAAVDPQPLSELRLHNPQAPYHLINAAVNLPWSKESGLRGRSADFFLFSHAYCGSPLLGYVATGNLEKKDPNLDLGTAMAVSGAAASSQMGTKTVRGLTFWLSLLNIRLGYWLPNPKRLDDVPDGLGARPFSLWREMFGRIDEYGRYVNLSDGGHIENLGIYELLRRRCKYIIAIDAEADPRLELPSLMQLIRYARIDFGIEIRIDLADVRPNESGFTKAHFTLGEIDYGGGQVGYLLYIKSSLTGNELDYVLDYRRRHPSFPHETTADQFFNEAQFEAYRALGEHIGNDLFHPELLKGSAGLLTLESWFGALLHNLQAEPVGRVRPPPPAAPLNPSTAAA
jgi:hypothetical protein